MTPSKHLITNGRVVTPTGILDPGWIIVLDSAIAAIGHGVPPSAAQVETVNAEGLLVLPGFIDVHVHGADGYDTMDASYTALTQMARFYAKHGVTGFLATTWTAPGENILAALRIIKESAGPISGGAAILGAHLEGPYLNPVRCGAQDIRQIRRAVRDEALRFLEPETIRLLALAPEYAENHWLIEECVSRGIAVSAAHSDATFEQMETAVRLGLSQATHTFNAMPGLHHRQPGLTGAALTLAEVNCELIADNIHVHPAMMRLLTTAKGSNRVILITDAVRGAGLPDGTIYEQDGREVRVSAGSVQLSDGTLAGSALTMDRALHNLMKATGRSISELWPTTSLNAARALGLSSTRGSLEAGKLADLVLITDEVEIRLTMCAGEIVFRKGM